MGRVVLVSLGISSHFLITIQGWTLYEVLRYAPEHNWIAYEQALKANPVLAKMIISGVVYAIGDWIAQVSFCYYEIILTLVMTSFFFGDLLVIFP